MGRTCKSCTKKKVIDLHPYINFLLLLRNLMERGWKVDKNDIYFETWLDIIKMENAIYTANKKRRDQQRGSK